MVDVIDKLQPSFYERVGKELIVALSHAFYTRVFADEDEEFRSMFNHATIEEAARNQYEFFIQRLGGPPLYSERKGHPTLRMRHARFRVNKKTGKQWLDHMKAAMEEVGLSHEGGRGVEAEAFWGFLVYVADFLRNCEDE